MRPSGGGHVHATEGGYHGLQKERTMLLRCESLEPPMSQTGQSRRFRDVRATSALVERHSRFTMLVKLPRKDTTTVVAALAKHIRKLPEQLRRSLTWDQGKEMSGHKRF